ncbi:MAG: hypothetical protein LBK22_08825 [Tannerella sp.]|jgi:hypothetical protein|nr:hypothetical protein [Tannerella sp.]
MKLKIGILIFALAAFVSCDCLLDVQGTVIDAETRQPLSDVTVKKDAALAVHAGDTEVCTDSIGNFNFSALTGCFLNRPAILLSFEKEGYNTAIGKYPSCCSKNVVVVLERQEK